MRLPHGHVSDCFAYPIFSNEKLLWFLFVLGFARDSFTKDIPCIS